MQNNELYSLLLALTKKSLEIINTRYDENFKLSRGSNPSPDVVYIKK
jgi:hypothetical protein